MLENGFIKLHRNILKWCWYDDPITRSMFIHLLLTVNYEDRQWRNITIKRGSRVASYGILATELKISCQQARTAIEHLEITGEVTRSAHAKFTVFSVNNYDRFQSGNKQNNKETTSISTSKATSISTNNQQASNNNERKYKNIKEEKKKEDGTLSPLDAAEQPEKKLPDFDLSINRF